MKENVEQIWVHVRNLNQKANIFKKHKLLVEEKIQTLVAALAQVQDKIVALQQEHKKEDMDTEKNAALSNALAKVESKLDALEEATKKPDEK